MFWVSNRQRPTRSSLAASPVVVLRLDRLLDKVNMLMARCERGYLCEVCGEDVEELVDSDLYLRFVLGEVDPERLHKLPERHIQVQPGAGPVHRRL